MLFGGVFCFSRVSANFLGFFFFGVARIIFRAKPSKAGNLRSDIRGLFHWAGEPAGHLGAELPSRRSQPPGPQAPGKQARLVQTDRTDRSGRGARMQFPGASVPCLSPPLVALSLSYSHGTLVGQGTFPRGHPGHLLYKKKRGGLRLVDISRTPSGTFFLKVHPISEMASKNACLMLDYA